MDTIVAVSVVAMIVSTATAVSSVEGTTELENIDKFVRNVDSFIAHVLAGDGKGILYTLLILLLYLMRSFVAFIYYFGKALMGLGSMILSAVGILLVLISLPLWIVAYILAVVASIIGAIANVIFGIAKVIYSIVSFIIKIVSWIISKVSPFQDDIGTGGSSDSYFVNCLSIG